MDAQISLSGFTPYKHIASFSHHEAQSFNNPSLVSTFASNRGCSIELKCCVSLSFRKSDWCRMRVQCKKESVMLEEDGGRSGLEGFGMNVERKKLAVFVSGGGSNFRAIHEATVGGEVNGDVVLVVTNKEGCGGAQCARDRGIPVFVFPKSKGEPGDIALNELMATLMKCNVDLIFLAGYLKLIPLELISAYPRRIINIHPSLLPSFGGKGSYGMKVHKQVIASGARYSGATIHFVDVEYDKGPILAQRVVPVLASDSPEDLAARVLKEEHCLYVEVAAAMCEGRIVWRDNGVPLIRSREDPNAYC